MHIGEEVVTTQNLKIKIIEFTHTKKFKVQFEDGSYKLNTNNIKTV